MKVKLKRSQIIPFIGCIDGVIKAYKGIISQEYNDEDCVILALMEDLYISLSKKVIEVKEKYSFDLKPAHAFAIRVVFRHPVGNAHMDNMLRQICDRIHQEFATKIS